MNDVVMVGTHEYIHKFNYDVECQLIYAPDHTMSDWLNEKAIQLVESKFGGRWMITDSKLTSEHGCNYYTVTLER